MCTCINKNQFQRIIVLAPNQQPTWFKMTFPTARIFDALFKERLNCPVYITSYMAMGYSSIWEIKSCEFFA